MTAGRAACGCSLFLLVLTRSVAKTWTLPGQLNGAGPAFPGPVRATVRSPVEDPVKQRNYGRTGAPLLNQLLGRGRHRRLIRTTAGCRRRACCRISRAISRTAVVSCTVTISFVIISATVCMDESPWNYSSSNIFRFTAVCFQQFIEGVGAVFPVDESADSIRIPRPPA